MIETQLDKLAKTISKHFEVDIFKNTRKRDVVDARYLFCYVAYNTYRLTYHAVAEYFRRNGKPFDHSTAVYGINQYEVIMFNNPKAKLVMSEILKEIDKDAHTEFLMKSVLQDADQKVKDEVSKYLNTVYTSSIEQKKSPVSY
jgi:hypothetical protein